MLRQQEVVRSQREASRVRQERRRNVEAVHEVPEVLPPDLVEQAVARYRAGELPRVIGLALGVSAARVYRVLKQCGVVRSKSEARMMTHARRRAAGERYPANVGPTEVEAEVVGQ